MRQTTRIVVRFESEGFMDAAGSTHLDLSLPLFGAQVFIEPGQNLAEIDGWFRTLQDHELTLCRIRMFEVYMQSPVGQWDFSLYDTAFEAARRHNVKILATLFPATDFSDVGGFKFPRSTEHLEQIAIYIQAVVTHFKQYSSLAGWVLMNEPGLGMPQHRTAFPETPFAREQFRRWQADQPAPVYKSRGYTYSDFKVEAFLMDFTVWFLHWLAAEIERHDPGCHLHVNNHAIFINVAEYDFPAWRPFLHSLGGSAHAAWHFGDFQRSQYALAMAADCEIIHSGAGQLPWLMTEIQGGNNIYSGSQPLCPRPAEIIQWLWTILACGGKGGIFWTLNARASGREAGEWALLDFHDQPSDRLLAAAGVARVVREQAEFFSQTAAVPVQVHILYVRQSLWVERSLQTGMDDAGRGSGAVMQSALGYFEVLTEMGIPCRLGEIGEYDFSGTQACAQTIILAHQVSLPSCYWPALEQFVADGGKLLIDGLTAYYDEHAHCIMQKGFPLEQLCGASIREFQHQPEDFSLVLSGTMLELPAHGWQGTLRLTTAVPLATSSSGQILACRNHYGAGEVCWLPSPVGLGGRLKGYTALASFLEQELSAAFAAAPLRVQYYQSGLLLKTLFSAGRCLSVMINKSPHLRQFSCCTSTLQNPVLLAKDGEVAFNGTSSYSLGPEATLVLIWERG